MNDDTNDLVKQDAKKAKRAYRNYKQGSWKPSLPKVIESIAGMFCIMSIIFLVAALPFVGADKAISGTAWIGIGCTGIVVFGGLWYVMRVMHGSFEDADKAMSEKFERGR